MTPIERIRLFRKSPLAFIKWCWGLTPERDNEKFIRGKHITWQQHDILLGIEEALKGNKPRRISIVKGHGVGGSTLESWLIFWWLFCFKESQIGCTAPSSEQMYDVLWKECSKWHQRMKPEIKNLFIWETTHIRVSENPKVWFARAKTARKEAPEALAGIHGDYVMLIADEASGVPEEIYNTAEGSLTEKNIFVLLISNGTRNTGYFYETHNKDKENWQNFSFSSIDSPIVDWGYVARLKDKHGEDSDEYRIRVLGRFPKEEGMDDKGYLPLFHDKDFRFIPDNYDFRFGGKIGIDCAGEGKDKTSWVLRDAFTIKRIAEEKKSTPKSIAEKTSTLMFRYGVQIEDVYFDGFGEGAKAANELRGISGKVEDIDRRPNVVMLGDNPEEEIYLNIRAENAFRFRYWCANGGQIIDKEIWEDQLKLIRYIRNMRGKVKLMDKPTMKKLLGRSPDDFDAAILTFTDDNFNEDKSISTYSSIPETYEV